MKTIGSLATVLLTATLAGCIVAPPPRPVYVAPPPPRPAVYAAPPGVVYVEPAYAVPGPGYVWMYNPHFGWGWHHPQHGWHRGWR